MRRFFVALVAALVAPVVFSQTPSDAVTTFAMRWSTRDLKHLPELVLGADQKEFLANKTDDVGYPRLVISNPYYTITGDTAIVQAQVAQMVVDARGVQPPYVLNETIHLRKIGDRWLIVPAEPSIPDAFGFFPKCALRISDPTHSLTYRIEAVQSLASNYLSPIRDDGKLNSKIMGPSRPQTITWRTGEIFSINSQLDGLRIFQPNRTPAPRIDVRTSPHQFPVQSFLSIHVPNESRIVLAYEGAEGRLHFGPNEKAAVYFLNGSCRYVGHEEAGKLLWKVPAAPRNDASRLGG